MPVTHAASLSLPPGDCTGDVLCVENLSFSYPDGHTALRDVSLTLCAGEKAALVGPNGAGKSTLMLHLNGILAGEGRIHVGGLPLEKANLPFIRALVGLVFQNPDDQLFSPTVYEDVAFGPLHMGLPEEQIRLRVEAALKQVRMEAYSGRLSHHLSVGEKKRIAIATVLSMDPDILVLDEPSSNLDPRHRRDLMELLGKLPMTKIIASHDLDFIARTCTRVALLDAGAVMAAGDVKEILGDQTLMERFGMLEPGGAI
jgi:cobalt/nickel transport system ATP-binding protein